MNEPRIAFLTRRLVSTFSHKENKLQQSDEILRMIFSGAAMMLLCDIAVPLLKLLVRTLSHNQNEQQQPDDRLRMTFSCGALMLPCDIRVHLQ